ncbi:hypothetical protein ZHAS_00005928 [Anopheles sinensis]|uniref:Uncharacterized protein n=1 Tax=Anopheles sinensis TaxID=74873 RepID=A0A084VKM6_ANOSI|nr:hypothetical protein ZHAS_00005928 [Anopheles sinensis]
MRSVNLRPSVSDPSGSVVDDPIPWDLIRHEDGIELISFPGQEFQARSVRPFAGLLHVNHNQRGHSGQHTHTLIPDPSSGRWTIENI